MTINTNPEETIYIFKRDDWRDWLINNHKEKKEIWLIYYKKHTGQKRISYDDAVEEAICFGWIDSTVKRIDDKTYMQKFLPRNKKSKWSDLNKIRALKMIESGKMTELGFQKIKEAKDNGNWDNSYGSKEKKEIPDDLMNVLLTEQNALNNFLNFAVSYQNSYIYWINDAKREDTRKRRILKVFNRASENLKPGMI